VDNGDSNNPTDCSSEGGDLAAKDCREIERHLADCAACRREKAAWEAALGALAVAATHWSVPREAPALWPALERRISRHYVRRIRPWCDLDAELPLQQAWTRDTIREALAGRNRRDPISKRKSRVFLGVSAAAALFITLGGIAIVRRHGEGAQSTIIANAAPLPDPVAPSMASDDPSPDIADDDSRDIVANQLAEAEPARASETPLAGVDTPAAPKPLPRTRLGFDLDHGIPIPPDNPEVKPVY